MKDAIIVSEPGDGGTVALVTQGRQMWMMGLTWD
jgi:hypothetical protein